MLGDLILSIILLIMGIGVLISTSQYPDFGALSVIGPEFLPNLVAYFFLIAAVVFLIKLADKTFIHKTDSNGVSYLQTEKEKVRAVCQSVFKDNFWTNLRVAITVLMVVAYGFLLPHVGYEILTAVFLVVSMLLNGIRKPLLLVVVPILTLVAIYVVFVLLLKVQIPRLIY